MLTWQQTCSVCLRFNYSFQNWAGTAYIFLAAIKLSFLKVSYVLFVNSFCTFEIKHNCTVFLLNYSQNLIVPSLKFNMRHYLTKQNSVLS